MITITGKGKEISVSEGGCLRIKDKIGTKILVLVTKVNPENSGLFGNPDWNDRTQTTGRKDLRGYIW